MVQRKFALIFIPHAGLHYAGAGEFLDGKGNRVSRSGKIYVYASHSRALTAKKKILEKYGAEYSQGHLVVINVEIIEVHDVPSDLEI